MRSPSLRLLGFACCAAFLAGPVGVAFALNSSSRPIFRTPAPAPMQGAGEYTSVALDRGGFAHVAWFDAARGALEYAWQVPGGWRSEEVDRADGGPVGWYASLALDGHGVAHIAYYDAARGLLKHAERRGSAWTIESVDPSAEGAGHYCSLALTQQGEPAISYYDPHQLCLRFAVRAGGAWTRETVDGAGNVAEAETAVDRADKDSKTPEVSQDVPNVGLYSSLAIGRDGTPHISYQDVSNADLKVAVKHKEGWLLETVDAQGDVGEHTSLKLDVAGRARVSYYDLQHGALKLAAEGADGRWATQTVDADGNVGAYCSLAVDEAGGLHVSYLDAARGALKYAESLEGGGWSRQVVDGRDGAGHNTALALARDGAPVIAYTARSPRGSFRLVSSSLGSAGTDAANRAGLTGVALSAGPLPYRGGALTVTFAIPPGSGEAEVSLIDVAGRHIRTLRSQARDAGQLTLTWDGRDDGQREVPDGVYFLVGRASGRESRLKLVVVR